MKIRRGTRLILVLSPLVLGGCSLLPASFQVASMALDGLSMVTTQKSLTDHGLSAIADKDCALWRGLAGDAVCQEPDEVTATALRRSADDPRPLIANPYLMVI